MPIPARRPVLATALGLGVVAATAPVAESARAAPPASTTAYSGYNAGLPYGEAATMTAAIVVPTVDCRDGRATLPIGVGVRGISVDTPTYAYGDVTVTCAAGGARYEAGVTITGVARGRTLPVGPGDTVTVRSTADRGDARVVVTVARTGGRVAGTGPGFSPSGATVQVEAAGSPRFTAVAFDDLRVGGRPYASVDPTPLRQVSGGAVVAAATPLSADGLAGSVRDRR